MPSAKRCLAVVERAFRGAIEEQYGHIVWLTRSLRRMRCEADLMLRGNTVLYGLRDQPLQALEIGGVRIDHLPHYESALRALLDDRATVFAERAAIRRLGLDEQRLMDGITLYDAEDFAAIIWRYDRVWYW